MGTPDYALPTLTTISTNPDYKITGVITKPDTPKGRGQTLSPTPIKEWAIKKNIDVYTPQSKEEITKTVNTLNPDLIVIVAYGHILPKEITDNYYCINSHASLLPKYRGASPIQAALLNNESKTGITYFKLTAEMDNGPILLKKEVAIEKHDTVKTLHDKLALLSAEAVSELLSTPTWQETEQDHTKASYCKKIQKEELELRPKDDSIEIIYNKIRAFSPFPGAYIIQNKKRLKIMKATFDNNTLKILEVKPEGKATMSYEDYLLGNEEIRLC